MSDNDLTPVHIERNDGVQETVHAEIVDDPYVTHNSSQPAVTFAEPTAFVALLLAVLSWIVLPVVGAIAALVIAPGAKRKIRASDGQLAGYKLAQAAQVIAVLNILAAAFIIWLLVQIIQWIF
jgi:cytochrome c biogenesis protein CcdA